MRPPSRRPGRNRDPGTDAEFGPRPRMPLNQESGLDSGCGRKDGGISRQLDDPGWTNYMIAVIYRRWVAPGKEERSRSGWRMATEAMYRGRSSPGSRLMGAENGTYYALAQ